MDAVEFIKERRRMCSFYGGGCMGCPASNASDASACLADIELQGDAEEQVRIVEEWSAAHPRKTRQSVFLEQWPDADRDKYGVCSICPKYVNRSVSCPRDSMMPKSCDDCRREFWMQEVE